MYHANVWIANSVAITIKYELPWLYSNASKYPDSAFSDTEEQNISIYIRTYINSYVFHIYYVPKGKNLRQTLLSVKKIQ